MRLVSTPESVESGDASVLAIIETILAIALVFYLSAHFNTLRWLAMAMLVSPLLLLRTEESTQLGVSWFDKWTERIPGPKNDFAMALIVLVGVTAVAFAARVSATVVTTLKAPAQALQAIPRNWSRLTLATDTLVEPEVVPGHPDLTLRTLLTTMRRGPRSRLFTRSLVLPLFLPAFFYRWSLKATSIIYAPLVFIVHATFRHAPNLRANLELIKQSDMTRILALYAVCYVAAFLLKLVLMMNLPGFADWWNGSPVRQFAALYVAPREIPKWQLASLINCAVALGAWFFARHALLRIEVGTPWRETIVQRMLGFATGLRTVLALYTIACTGYLTLRAARGWHWPALGEKWLPWQ